MRSEFLRSKGGDSKIQLKHLNSARKLHKRELGLNLGPADQSKPKLAEILSKMTNQSLSPENQIISSKSLTNSNAMIEEPLPNPDDNAKYESPQVDPKNSKSNSNSQGSFMTAKSKFHDANVSNNNSVLMGSDPGHEAERKKSTVSTTYVKKMELKDCEIAKMKAENCDLGRKNEELNLAILKMQNELASKEIARGEKLLDLD